MLGASTVPRGPNLSGATGQTVFLTSGDTGVRFELRGHESDAAAAWALVGDTEEVSRAVDHPRFLMEMVPDAFGFPEVRGAVVGPGPLTHRFVERDSRWVRGRWFIQDRRVEGIGMARMRYEARLEPAGAGVIPTITLTVDPRFAIGELAVWLSEAPKMRRWQAMLDALPRPGERVSPAPGGPAPVVGAVTAWMQTARAAALRELRPWALAREQRLPREGLVEALLGAVEAGALELYFASRCPRCLGTVQQADTLSDLADHATCGSCRIGFAPSLDEHIEVRFAAPVGLRPAAESRYCTLFPVERPEVLALLTLDAGATEEIAVDLPPGTWFLGAGGDVPDQELRVQTGGADVAWTAGVPAAPVALAPGEARVRLHNPGPGRQRVQLAGRAQADDTLTAGHLVLVPAWRRRYGSTGLAADVRLGVRAVAVLFTDLTGSAALYAEVGDAEAFRLVHAHFRLLEAVVESAGGVRVKSIGDALMAAFPSPLAAMQAAVEMQRRFGAWAAGLCMERPPGLRVGVHFGPALAVHTDQAGLDYFGGTVNLASRCEGRAPRGGIATTAAVAQDPACAAWLAGEGIVPEPFEAEVKGLPGVQKLLRMQISGMV